MGQLVQKFVPRSRVEFFALNAPDPPHWTLNFCFCAICPILVHLGLFGCLTKLGAERAELVQKFMPRSRIRIFRNDSTRSDPLDPKLMFWCASYYLGVFGTFGCHTTLSAKWVIKLVQKLVPRSFVGILATKTPDPPSLDPKLMFWCVSYYLGAFGTVWLHNNT